MNKLMYRKIIQYLLLVVTLLLILSGYGITQYRVVETLTFGLLNKAVTFKLHSGLIIPFFLLLVLHVFNFKRRKIEKNAQE